MDSGISYSYPTERRMQGGDIRYNMMTTSSLFREAQDEEMELKVKKVAERLSESMNIVANEPSLAFFRIQEHVRKSLPQLVEQKHEVIETQQKVQGASFDTEYATHAVKSLHKSSVHFQNIQELMKNAMFMKQQIDYEEDRKGHMAQYPLYTHINPLLLRDDHKMAAPNIASINSTAEDGDITDT
ncbi:BLOC-1-related complex subunit 8-like isoform X2 [Crassostrea angulata]|uniref:BLOC-1-related complex subunit 8-like isoform X2 n=1 Tax=Magallana angulata TaxID=2784310 RepID=UPI0022B1B986|nr:BLOC-1-related complex subunit 8-like isoform X2 [Crassostrea angulata]